MRYAGQYSIVDRLALSDASDHSHSGWLQQIRFGLVDYDEMIYLSDYNDPA
jgi:hypothetical protein